MINKENDDKTSEKENNTESGYIDPANMDVQCHILIKDPDTEEVLLNRRG